MKATTKEVVYVNPDLYQGDSTNTPSNSQVVYGNNPNLTTNEFGQTIVNPDIPKPLTPKEQAQQIIDDIKETIANTPKPAPKKTLTNVLAVNKELEIAKTTTPKKTTNYLLYGALGIGAVVIILGIIKK